MKVLFAGPTLPDARACVPKEISCRGPVLQGDVHEAVEAGATAIGIIDGGFEFTAPVWHKEILYALEAGVRVAGAASMGALRAAECQAFGMLGIGRVFEDYLSGRRVDDGDVAQLHGPEELGWMALTEPLVNVSATFERLMAQSLLTTDEAASLADAAEGLFFKERTWPAIIRQAAGLSQDDRHRLHARVMCNRVDQKRLDALDLIQALAAMPDERDPAPRPWRFVRTALWDEMLQSRSHVF